MGGLSVAHWLIVLVIIILLFGAKKIPELAKGLGKGIKTFKKEMEDDTPLEKIETTQNEKEDAKPKETINETTKNY